MMMVLNGVKMNTTGLINNDNKTDYNYSVNKKSNHDRGGNCAVDNDETKKCYPIELIFEIGRTRHQPDESTRTDSTGHNLHRFKEAILPCIAD
jgi:hypothetical protein